MRLMGGIVTGALLVAACGGAGETSESTRARSPRIANGTTIERETALASNACLSRWDTLRDLRTVGKFIMSDLEGAMDACKSAYEQLEVDAAGFTGRPVNRLFGVITAVYIELGRSHIDAREKRCRTVCTIPSAQVDTFLDLPPIAGWKWDGKGGRPTFEDVDPDLKIAR